MLENPYLFKAAKSNFNFVLIMTTPVENSGMRTITFYGTGPV